MSKINFNTPFLNEADEPVMRVKFDDKKVKVTPQGQTIPSVVLDGEGNAVQEPVMVKDMLVKILHRGFEGDEKLSFEEKARRGKLAHKIQSNSTVHYTNKEIEIITELSARAGSTLLISRIDDLIYGASHDEKAA